MSRKRGGKWVEAAPLGAGKPVMALALTWSEVGRLWKALNSAETRSDLRFKRITGF